jgi:hypothetical protein
MDKHQLPKPTDDFFARLNAEIAKVIDKPKLEAELAKAKRTVRNARATDAEIKTARESIARIAPELIQISWTAKANVAFFSRTICACGASTTTFVRLMQRIISNAKPHVERWAIGVDLNNDLPNEVIYQDKPRSTICQHCAEAAGFDLSLGAVKHVEVVHGSAA